MNEKLALRVLGDVMGWPDGEATTQFHWLRLMSRIKYDGYQDYLAGARFLESLAGWIQQFSTSEDRAVAYEFARRCLVYIGPMEMLRLVELLYPDQVQRMLVRTIAETRGIRSYRVWADPDAILAYEQLLARTLFVALSDGARLDLFRRANAGVVTNEQIVVATHIDDAKWADLLKKLRKLPGQGADARFAIVFLIDDFAGSGKTFLRKDAESGQWEGKLARFRETIGPHLQTHFCSNLRVRVHHYVANHDAADGLINRQAQALGELGSENWFSDVTFSFGTILPKDLPITSSGAPEARKFVGLAERYYDPAIENEHTKKGGTDMRLGFAGCALPVVLEHNTPNNSVSLLWAESEGDDKHGVHAMRPLFRRRQRHG